MEEHKQRERNMGDIISINEEPSVTTTPKEEGEKSLVDLGKEEPEEKWE